MLQSKIRFSLKLAIFSLGILLISAYFSLLPRMKVAINEASFGLLMVISLCLLAFVGFWLYLLNKKKVPFRYQVEVIFPLLMILPIYLLLRYYQVLNTLFVVEATPIKAIAAFLVLGSVIFIILCLVVTALSFFYDLTAHSQAEVVAFQKNEDPMLRSRWNRFKVFWNHEWEKYSLDSVWSFVFFLALLGVAFYSVSLFNQSFTIPLSGDYTQQQIPFYTNGYDDWWHFFKTGEFVLWDHNTNLGVNNIGANAFYYFLNPFFLPILLFPRAYIAQGMAVLMVGKMILAVLSMRAYLKYMGVKEGTARLFAIAFGFGGWMTYYLWFNHFMEVVVVFPLIFLGVEKVLKEQKPWFLMGAVALMGFSNYFFLVSTCMAAVLYAGFRYFQLFEKYTVKQRLTVIGLGFVGFLAGIMLCSIPLLPGVTTAMNSDRVTNATYWDNIKAAFEVKNWKLMFDYVLRWETVSTSYEHKKYFPLITFFFPTLSDRSSPLLNTSGYDNTISSIFIYTPLTLLLIPSFIESVKKRKVSHILAIGFFVFALFTPFFYNLFHGFTKEYGRWQIWVAFSMITYVALNFDQREKMPKWYFDVSFIVVILGAYATFAWAFNYQGNNGFGQLLEREYMAYYSLFAIGIGYIIYRLASKKQLLPKYLFIFMTVEAIVMGTATMFGHSLTSYETQVGGGISVVQEETEVIDKINRDDKSFFRIYSSNAYHNNDNIGMRENYNGLGAFHSVYNFELMDFNSWSRVNYNYNGWSMGVQEKRYNLDTFLGVKYYILRDTDSVINFTNGTSYDPGKNVPYGFERVYDGNQNDIYSSTRRIVYRNENYIELGFTFDQLMPSNYQIPSAENKTSNFFHSGRHYEVVPNEEHYLSKGILDMDDLSEVIANYPSLTEVPYTTSTEASLKTISTGVAANKLKQSFIDCHGSNIPYQNIPSIGTTLNCTISSTLPSRIQPMSQAIMYEMNNSTNISSTGAQLLLDWPLQSYARVFLIDENDQVITFDNHNNVYGSLYFKRIRGLYSDVPVKKVLIVPTQTATEFPSSGFIYVDSYANIDARLNRLREYPLTDITNSANRFTFKTNFDHHRFVVLSIPYDEGWSVKITNNLGEVVKPKVYKAQGGFVGFVAEPGVNDYVVKYWTPYLTESLLLTLSGLVIFGGTWGAAFVIEKKKHRRDIPLVKVDKLEPVQPE